MMSMQGGLVAVAACNSAADVWAAARRVAAVRASFRNRRRVEVKSSHVADVLAYSVVDVRDVTTPSEAFVRRYEDHNAHVAAYHAAHAQEMRQRLFALQHELAEMKRRVGDLAAELSGGEEFSFDRPRMTPGAYVRQVCAGSEFTVNDLKSARRGVKLALFRQKLFYELKHLYGMSLTQIGQMLNRDHTTVLHGINKIDGMIKRGELGQ